MELANPVGGIGFGIQTDLYGPFTATVSIYDSALTFMTTLTFNGVSGGGENGSNLFIGIQDKTAVNIGAIVIDSFSGGSPWDHDFALALNVLLNHRVTRNLRVKSPTKHPPEWGQIGFLSGFARR